MPKYRLMVAIPAFNESKTIQEVIKKIPKRLPSIKSVKIVVIDDGSSDKTSFVSSKYKVRIVRHIINRGLGAALKTAFTIAKSSYTDILVTIDADGQHDPENIRRLIAPIINKRADVVIGSRLKKNKHMPVERKIINYCANVATFFLTGIWSSDSQSGFRAFSRNAINKINLITQRMEVSSEIFGQVKKNKLRLKEVSINPIYTEYSLKKGQSITNAPNVFYKLLIRIFR